MANENIQKHSVNSAGCDGRRLLTHSRHRSNLFHHVAKRLSRCNNFGMTPFLRIALLVPSFLLCTPHPSHAQQFLKITAEIQTLYFPKGDTNDDSQIRKWPISVVCVVGTNEWRIDDNYLENGERQWHFDGANVYSSTWITKPHSGDLDNKLKKLGIAVVPFEAARSNRTIYVDSSPYGHPLGDVGVNIAWLAFCSGTYLKREGRVLPIPVAPLTLRRTPDGFAYSDKTDLFRDDFGLPREIELFTSSVHFEKSIRMKHLDGDHDPAKYQERMSQLGNGKSMFHYKVAEITNFMGWIIPLKFDYVQNDVDISGVVTPRFGGKGRVSKIEVSGKPEGVFMAGQGVIKDG